MKTLHEKARRLHTHTVVFESADEVDCCVRAMLGHTTKAIAAATGLTEWQVTYRLHKAAIARKDYRNCTSDVAMATYNAMSKTLRREVNQTITPRFAKLKQI